MNNWEGCQGAHISTCKQRGKRAEITEERAREEHSEAHDFYGAGKRAELRFGEATEVPQSLIAIHQLRAFFLLFLGGE